MSFRVAEVEDIRIKAIKVRFGSGIRSIWMRLQEHPTIEVFIRDFDGHHLKFASANGSRLEVEPTDITDFNLSFVLKYEYYDQPLGWHPSMLEKPPHKNHVFPTEIVKSGANTVAQEIKRLFGPRI